MRRSNWRALVLLTLVFATQALAGDLEGAFNELRRRGMHGSQVKDVGQLCEHLALLELEKRYPRSRFDLEIGIAYGSSRATPKGELDVTVFDRSTSRAVLIAEVKCWDDIYEAASKARSQRRRFTRAMESGESVRFFPLNRPRQEYDPRPELGRRRFEPLPPFILVSQKHGEQAGFDMTMDFSLDEIGVLVRMLQGCDTFEECREMIDADEFSFASGCEDVML